MTEDTKRELIEIAEGMDTFNIRDKERRFCRVVLEGIKRNHGTKGVREVWFRTETGVPGELSGTSLEKWYDLLKEFRSAFAGAVEAGEITGSLMMPTAEIL